MKDGDERFVGVTSGSERGEPRYQSTACGQDLNHRHADARSLGRLVRARSIPHLQSKLLVGLFDLIIAGSLGNSEYGAVGGGGEREEGRESQGV